MDVTLHHRFKGEPLVLGSGVPRVIEGRNKKLIPRIPRVTPVHRRNFRPDYLSDNTEEHLSKKGNFDSGDSVVSYSGTYVFHVLNDHLMITIIFHHSKGNSEELRTRILRIVISLSWYMTYD